MSQKNYSINDELSQLSDNSYYSKNTFFYFLNVNNKEDFNKHKILTKVDNNDLELIDYNIDDNKYIKKRKKYFDVQNKTQTKPTTLTDRKKKIKTVKEKERKRMGRKPKNSTEEGIHTKYHWDNIMRRIKGIILNLLYEFINKKIIKNLHLSKYKIKRNTLKKINQKQSFKTNIDFNKEFLSKTLKDIFSDNISTKYTYDEKHNEIIINKCLKAKDNEAREYFEKLFSLSFLDCLKYFRKDENLDEKMNLLKEMETYDEYKKNKKNKKNFLNDVDCMGTFEHYMKNFESFIMRKEEKIQKRNKKKN